MSDDLKQHVTWAANPCAEVDVSAPPFDPESVEPRLRDAARRLCAIPHVRIHEIGEATAARTAAMRAAGLGPTPRSGERQRALALVECPSPTLHGITCDVAAEPLADPTSTTEPFRFDALIARLEARARAVQALGLTALPALPHIDHLSVDSALPRLCAEAGVDLHGHVREAIRRLHAGAVLRPDSAVLEVGAFAAAEGAGGLRIVFAPVPITAPGSPTFDGSRLAIDTAALPETVLAALVGRPVSDLARVHPLVDGRTIRSARNVAPRPVGTGSTTRPHHVALGLASDPLRIADLPPSS